MISYVHGDLLSDSADLLVNPVNCVGVMGKGLALQFKERFPYAYNAYREICEGDHLVPGFPAYIPLAASGFDAGRGMVLFPTKRHWRDLSRIEWIEDGLEQMCMDLSNQPYISIALPQVGCGLGGLDWADVSALIEPLFNRYPNIDLRVYGHPHSKMPASSSSSGL